MGSRRYGSYGKFKLPAALKKFCITQVMQTLNPELYQSLSQEFTQERDFTPSSTFQNLFHRGRTVFLGTSGPQEETRKIRLIWPFLFEIEGRHPKLRIWEGVTFEADPDQGLTGEPDYIVAKQSNILEAPYCIIMEAKQMDFSQGWGQALTAMKGAQILNQKEASKEIPIYGVVSTGEEWQFGKLVGNHCILYPISATNILKSDNEVKEILTILDIIFEECEKKIE